MNAPARGDVWLVDLEPTRGREQAGRRPALVVSEDVFNEGPSELVVVVPLTSTLRSIPMHVRIQPPEGGLKHESAALCDGVRSISRSRLGVRWGRVTRITMMEVEDRLRILMGL